ncbi:Mad3/BUB1 homology region 1-domain-containing protein [Sphaerosporella brunnea]|uniref:Mad3/BUB1 homology region 1-domain-containing protein n=1 Tax=Sphaerosporella brunnea TaxID=1250544 RepID=A0A5J5F0S3_9PEZI|nr:Mad3/BUB1 homology region 1-domain-containing protein [Sphaerosporella brunnea]
MANLPTTDFDLIEGHKENIQPIRSGRSARALVASLSPLSANPHAARSEHCARQAEFEEELKIAAELDDPLEVWLRYINWTVETFPSGHSAEAGLLQLLERATKEFAHDSQYKNDPRYLRLWIQYAQDFTDSPTEIFAYLSRNDIGQRLALFYEEYAALLESLGRRTKAGEIYRSGLDNNANPLKRLQRKYGEYLQRIEANPPGPDEPSSPALPAVRPALAAKAFGSSAASGGLGQLDGESDPQRQPQPATAKPTKQKMAIFSDADQPPGDKPAPVRVTAGWDNIGSLEHRKKENAQEARPWAGEILKQQTKAPQTERLMVFRDSSKMHDTPSSLSISAPGKRPERIAANLELVYSQEEDEHDEFCFEELRAKSRGLYCIDWKAQREAEKAHYSQPRQPLEGSRAPIKIKTVLSPSPKKGKLRRKGPGRAASPTMTFHTKAATDMIYDIFNQPLQKPAQGRESGDSDESDFADDSEGDYTTSSMESLRGEDDDAESVHSDWSDFNLAKTMPKPDGTQNEGDEDEAADTFAGPDLAIAANKMQKLSIFIDEREPSKSKPPSRRLHIPGPPEDFNPPTLPYHQAKDQSHMQSRLPYMTPIVERTESLPATIARKALQAAKTPSRGPMPVIDDDDDDNFLGGSPFHSIANKAPPPLDLLRKKTAAPTRTKAPVKQGPIIDDTVCNPVDPGMRAIIYEKLQPPLTSYDGYYEYPSMASGRAPEIKKFTKATGKRDAGLIGSIPEAPLLEFVTGQGGSSYTVKRELGKGAYAPVYLVENNTVGDAEDELDEGAIDRKHFNQIVRGRKRLEALKMEHPPSAWEFYMLKQAHMRLRDHRAIESVVQAYEMHHFKDEGFLLIEYRDQGTILDLVNIAKAESGVMDELLVMFLSIELLRTIEALHAESLIHGDIKADNCLVRFEPIPDNEWLSKYQVDGSGGWSKKGITFIDFGRGIDMKLFRPEVQFIADWKTDQQDCAEMREMRPWTYQVDYYGIAAIIHSMLFGKYIQTVAERSGLPGGGPKNYKLTTPFKRYWEYDIWLEVFDILLNPLQHVSQDDGGVLPITSSVRRCRIRMQEHLAANCDKGIGLKTMIRKMEATASRRR